MPVRSRQLTEQDVAAYARSCFEGHDDLTGAEVEWIVHPAGKPDSPARWPDVRASIEGIAFERGVMAAFEPGGQLELISPPMGSARDVCDAIGHAFQRAQDAVERAGHDLRGIGLDPVRMGRRVLDVPRYAAMEEFFDGDGPDGRAMMTRTAAIQVNVGCGSDASARWRRAHAIGPVLAAAFANSPHTARGENGWRSNRLRTWFAIDPTRTAPADDGDDPVRAWTTYMLKARVMLVRNEDGSFESVRGRMTFGQWMKAGYRDEYPTLDDLVYHCTTLFPPVRARGWLEVRMCDALPDPWWRVPVLVIDRLLRDDDAGSRAEVACAEARGMWIEAARDGLSNPVLARIAREIFSLCDDDEVVGFATRYVNRRVSPADDLTPHRVVALDEEVPV